LAQGIGLIGMALVFIAFQQNKKEKILWIQASAAISFAVHFFMLGAWTGMSMNLLEIPRNVIFACEHEKRKQMLLTMLFIALFVILGIFTWESPMSMFPISAMSLSTIVFSLRKPSYIRFFGLPVSAFWLAYNIISMSVAGVLTESFCLLSIIIAIFRFDVLKKKDNDTMCS